VEHSFRNDGLQKLTVFLPIQTFQRIKDIGDIHDVQYSSVAQHAILEYFKAIDFTEEY